MKWVKKDLAQYVQATEYIDTILMPLIPFQLSEQANLEKNAFQGEVLNLFTHELEKELTGRTLLVPAYYYLKSADKMAEIKRINDWIEDMEKQPFSHVFLLTFDFSWKRHDRDLHGDLLWLSGISTDEAGMKELERSIRLQVKEVSELIRSYWQYA